MEQFRKILAVLISIFLVPTSSIGFSKPYKNETDRAKLNQKTQEELKKTFVSHLFSWSDQNNVGLDHGFQLDRRFVAVPCLSGYRFMKHKSSATLVEATCEEKGWTKHLNIQSKNNHLSAQQKERSSASVFVLRTALNKGDVIRETNLESRELNRRLVPMNYQKTFPKNNNVAKNNLRKGKILLKSDIYEPEFGLTATMLIPRGASIEPHMVARKLIADSKGSKIVTDVDHVKFLETNKPIPAGSPILSKDMRKAKLVKRGDMVIVASEGTGFEIKSLAKAAKDGYFGDQVILDAQGGRRIRGLVSGKNRATAIK